ncbi:MAG TPA: polymer-forming cytoskeletal protein [Oligoflexia bacterium]|nr:polymer-forming cytoskeletal protein [Oligoflexia bacterium]HMP26731.1 polymer-forming cytoskeletal protein [Oligoflexia bacterium]
MLKQLFAGKIFGKKNSTNIFEQKTDTSILKASGLKSIPPVFLKKGAKISGNIFFNQPVTIEGAIKGSIKSKDMVFIASDGIIEAGELISPKAIIAGVVNGDLNISENLQILNQGVVNGLVKAGSVSLQEGGMLIGQVKIGR